MRRCRWLSTCETAWICSFNCRTVELRGKRTECVVLSSDLMCNEMMTEECSPWDCSCPVKSCFSSVAMLSNDRYKAGEVRSRKCSGEMWTEKWPHPSRFPAAVTHFSICEPATLDQKKKKPDQLLVQKKSFIMVAPTKKKGTLGTWWQLSINLNMIFITYTSTLVFPLPIRSFTGQMSEIIKQLKRETIINHFQYYDRPNFWWRHAAKSLPKWCLPLKARRISTWMLSNREFPAKTNYRNSQNWSTLSLLFPSTKKRCYFLS